MENLEEKMIEANARREVVMLRVQGKTQHLINALLSLSDRLSEDVVKLLENNRKSISQRQMLQQEKSSSQAQIQQLNDNLTTINDRLAEMEADKAQLIEQLNMEYRLRDLNRSCLSLSSSSRLVAGFEECDDM